MTPWIQVVGLEWRPELRFFEVRRPLLQELEARKLMTHFNWAVDFVIVRIGDHAAVRIAPNGATAWIASPKEGTDRVREVLRATFSALRPDHVALSPSRVRCLAPIALDAEAAQRQTALGVVGRIWPEAHATDWALLVDATSDRLQAKFQVEYGVVRPEEVRQRYTGLGVRIGPLQMPVPPDLSGLPASSVFLDWYWPETVAVKGDSLEGVVARWDGLLAESVRLSLEICNQIIPGYTKGEEKRA
ncbi:MAG: hypothetical protein WA751_09965 [Candidatus Dormiibacterota bacterium]